MILGPTFNLTTKTVFAIIQAYRRTLTIPHQFQKRHSYNRKISKQQLEWLVKPETLNSMKHLTLKERVILLRQRHSLAISASTLARYYSLIDIRYIQVDLASTAKLKKQEEIRQKQKLFALDLYYFRSNYYVCFIDETSISYWSNIRKKTWTDSHSVTFPYQASRGVSHTIYGCIAGFMSHNVR